MCKLSVLADFPTDYKENRLSLACLCVAYLSSLTEGQAVGIRPIKLPITPLSLCSQA